MAPKDKNLLIIDDEPDLLDLLSMGLGEIATKVFTAKNGKEALEIITKEEIHCIVSDVNMPVMNGIAFVRTLRQKGLDVPVIFYTAHLDFELQDQLGGISSFELVSKPGMSGLEEVVSRRLQVPYTKAS